jgi:hypothetical protein
MPVHVNVLYKVALIILGFLFLVEDDDIQKISPASQWHNQVLL